MEDPYAVLGLTPDASEGEVVAAYRALAKQLHPDVSGDSRATTAAMAALNGALEALRGRGSDDSPPLQAGAARPAGEWLGPALGSLLGHELLHALEPRESVTVVTPASTWASPRALLALSDRRLLWLLDDAVANRVRWLRLRDVCAAGYTLRWPRRQRATLRVRARDGRRHAFSELRPALAARIVSTLQAPPI